MKKLVKILSVVAVAALFAVAVPQTQAAQSTYETVLAANAATCAATAGTNVAKVIDLRKQSGQNSSSVLFQIELMADDAGAYTFTLPIQRSVDGVVYGGMQPSTIAISFNGVTKQTIVTNIPTYGAHFLKIPYLTNATAAINVTNIVIKRGIDVP